MSLDFALSASALDLGQLREDLAAFSALGIDELVVDVMDGAFAPAYGFGARFIEAIATHGGAIRCHAHVMAHEPERRIADLIHAGAALVTVHAEACVHSHRLLDYIRATGAAPGIALRPTTPLTDLEYLLPGADRVVLMADEPGCAPTAPIPAMYERVKLLRDTLEYREWKTRIQVKLTAEPYAIAQADAAGAHGVILDVPVKAGPNSPDRLTPETLPSIQRDTLARRRALDLA